ncbi:MAG: hypothetical protein IPN97_15825 [Saprospiraceae bacterium]|nr:hypothetical protein [Saprospiraceae bacterium]
MLFQEITEKNRNMFIFTVIYVVAIRQSDYSIKQESLFYSISSSTLKIVQFVLNYSLI